MSELCQCKYRAEITVRNIKTGKVSVHTGRYGLYYECYALCTQRGYVLVSYMAIY